MEKHVSKPVPDSKVVRTNILTLQRLYDLEESDLQVLSEYFCWWMENEATYQNTSRAWNKFVEQFVFKTWVEQLDDDMGRRRGYWLRAVDGIRQKVAEGYPN